MPDTGTRLRQLEAISSKACVEESGITGVDEETMSSCSRKRLFERDMLFSSEVADASVPEI